MGMRTLFSQPFLQKHITDFPDPVACDACLSFAIRRPDPQAVKMLLALGVSPHGLPLGQSSAQVAIRNDLADITPLGLSIKMMKLTAEDSPDLFSRNTQVALLLIDAGASLNVRCMTIYPFTVADFAWSLSPEVLSDFESAAEARELRRALGHTPVQPGARRI
jgi:hypothetical protein